MPEPTTNTPAAAPAASTVKRSHTWLTRELPAFLRQHASAKFQWGVLDCCLFAADAVQAVTGVDIADDFRGKYADQASAFALIKSVTGTGTTVADAAAYCAAKHGLVEWKYPLQARRGDLVVVANAGNLIAGVVDLTGRRVACMGENGPLQISIMQIKRSWHVPAV